MYNSLKVKMSVKMLYLTPRFNIVMLALCGGVLNIYSPMYLQVKCPWEVTLTSSPILYFSFSCVPCWNIMQFSIEIFIYHALIPIAFKSFVSNLETASYRILKRVQLIIINNINFKPQGASPVINA